MDKIRIVTDSNAYLSPETLAKYPIDVIPHRIKVGGAMIEETDEFTADNLFTRYQEAQANGASGPPTIQAADVNTILDVYRRHDNDSEQIVSIHMSSQLSSMWQQARKAAEMLKGRYTIRVIDSMSTSFGLGLLVEEAAKAAAAGESINEIARIVNGAVPHLYVTAFSESLKFLEHSAGLNPSQSLLGTMLGIKPMIMMEEGQLVPLEKVQTYEEVSEKLIDFVVEFANIEAIGVVQHAYQTAHELFRQRLDEIMPDVAIYEVPYTPSLAAYLGPNMMGVMVYEGSY